jgi:integrase/recombinase XerD
MLPVATFLLKLKQEGASHKTIQFYQYPVEKFAAMLGEKNLHEITLADVYAFRDTVTSSDYYRHNSIRAIKYFLKKHGIQLEIRLPSFTPPAPDEYQPAQLKQLFSAANDYERRLFMFYLTTGCREQEVAHATWDCLSETEFVVKPKPEFGWNPKKFKTRSIPVSDNFSCIMEPVRGVGLIFPNRLGKPDGHHLKKLQALAKRSGQDPDLFCLQRFRRTFATSYLRGSATIHEVAGFLGHSNLDRVMRYLVLASSKSERVRGLANTTSFGGM